MGGRLKTVINVGADRRVRPENHRGGHKEGEGEEGRDIGLPLQKNGESFETVNDRDRGERKEGRHVGSPLPQMVDGLKP